jgi:hypothetical protein
MRKCDVYGTLVLGSSTYDSFMLDSTSNIIVHAGGVLEDQTNGHVFLFPENSLLTIYPGGLFVGDETNINTYSTSLTPVNGNNGILLGSRVNGPITCGILPGGTIEIYYKVTYIVSQSGEFTVDSNWLGGIAPEAAICTLVGGCGMSVSTGCQLSTTSLNGELNINFNEILIAAGATLRLGTPGSPAGFRFDFQLKIDCYGILVDATGGTGGIILPVGSALNFFNGASFSSAVATFLRISDLVSGAILPEQLSLGTSFSGPFYIAISLTGIITTSITSNER